MSHPAKTNAAARISVGLADKNPLIRAALKQLLTEDGRFELIHASASCREFLQKVEREPVSVGVTGWIFDNCDGRLLLDHLNGVPGAPRIVVYTGHPGDNVPALVMAHGGAAYVSKSEEPPVLLDTVASVAAGRMVFPFFDVRTLQDSPLATLTRRELEVLSDLATGLTNKQIARKLGLSLNTVKYHVRNVFQKLGVNSRGQAISLYLQT